MSQFPHFRFHFPKMSSLRHFLQLWTFVVMTTFLTFPLFSQNFADYQKAYTLESKYPLFSIPIYEEILSSRGNQKIRRTAEKRLLLLYKTWGKYPELFEYISENPNAGKLSEEIEQYWKRKEKRKELTKEKEILKRFYSSMKLDEKSNFLIQSLNNSDRRVFENVFPFFWKSKQVELLKMVFAGISEDLSTPYLKLAILAKEGNDHFYSMLVNGQMEKVWTDKEASDFFYLLGIFLRNKEATQMSTRYFYSSSAFSEKERGIKEASKNLIALGRFNEACSILEFSLNPTNESDWVLKYFCQDKDFDALEEISISMRLLSKKENKRFYEKILNSL